MFIKIMFITNILKKNRFFLIPFFLFFLISQLVFFTNNVYAEYRVAIVDLNRVVNSTAEAKIKQQELEKLSSDAKQEYQKRVDKLKKLEQEYIKTSDKNKSIELEKATRDLKIYVADKKEFLQKKFKDTNQKLIKDIVVVIKQYAKDNDIDLVLDKNSLVLGVVVYNQDAIDITQDLVEKVK